MSKYMNKGRLTIRTSLYISAFMISIVMGFSAPVTMVYFVNHVSPELVSTLAIVLKLCGVVVSYVKQSKVAIQWIADHFLGLLLGTEAVYLVLALIGEANPEIRYIGYNLIGCVGIKILKVACQSNVVNCLKSDAIIAFNATCDTWALVGSLIGSSVCATILMFRDINVTACMLLEFTGCSIGHAFQLYANRRIRFYILRANKGEYTIIDVLNDLARVKKRKSEMRRKDDNDDSIFDQ